MNKEFNKRDLILLGKDLLNAKIFVLYKHGFSCEEISHITNIGESVVKNFISNISNIEREED